MTISEILAVDRIRLDVSAASKKRALEEMSNLLAAAQSDLTPRAVFDRLLARERLGSTGLGRGVGLPHGRVPNLDRTVGAFIKMETGVDYDSPDGEPVDLLFGLLVPEECTDEHLEILAQLAGAFDDDRLRSELRGKISVREVCAKMDQQSARDAA